MADKNIAQLPVATAIAATDLLVLDSNGITESIQFQNFMASAQAAISAGATVTFGTTIPQNTTGKNGDVFCKTDTNAFYQRIAGTWTAVFTITFTNTGNAVLYGTGAPGLVGNNNDTYIDTLSGKFYQKQSGSWAQVFSMAQGPQGPQGTPGTNGTNGTNGNTILNGSGNPANTLGNNGDFYINTNTAVLFGPKAAGVWPATGINIAVGGTSQQVTINSGTQIPQRIAISSYPGYDQNSQLVCKILNSAGGYSRVNDFRIEEVFTGSTFIGWDIYGHDDGSNASGAGKFAENTYIILKP